MKHLGLEAREGLHLTSVSLSFVMPHLLYIDGWIGIALPKRL